MSAAHARITVLIVEDHQLFGQALASALARHEDLQVLGIARTAHEGIAQALAVPTDIVLMDYSLPDGDGLTAAAEIRGQRPSTRIVVVTAAEDDSVLAAAMRAGCAGYVSKSESLTNLATAVRSAHAGSTSLTPAMLARLVSSVARPSGPRGKDLTERELEILRLLGDGANNDGIAERLIISPNTARNHVQNILNKLNAHSKLEAVSKAIQAGVIPMPRRG